MHWVGRRETNTKLQYQFIQTRHETNLQEFQKFTRVITPIERAFIIHVVHSSRHIVALHARKSPLLVYLFTTSGEAFIRILTIVFKVERITKNATFK